MHYTCTLLYYIYSGAYLCLPITTCVYLWSDFLECSLTQSQSTDQWTRINNKPSLVCACVGSRSVLVLLHSLPYPVPCPEFHSPPFISYVRRTVKLSLKIQVYTVFFCIASCTYCMCVSTSLMSCSCILTIPPLPCPPLPSPPLPSPTPPSNQLRNHSRMR